MKKIKKTPMRISASEFFDPWTLDRLPADQNLTTSGAPPKLEKVAVASLK